MHCWVTLTALVGVSVWFLSPECSCALGELGQSQEGASVTGGSISASGLEQEPSELWTFAQMWMNEAGLILHFNFFFFLIIHQEANLAEAPRVLTKLILCPGPCWQAGMSLAPSLVAPQHPPLPVRRSGSTFGPSQMKPVGAWDWQGKGEQLWCSSKAKCCRFCIICKNMLSGGALQLARCHPRCAARAAGAGGASAERRVRSDTDVSTQQSKKNHRERGRGGYFSNSRFFFFFSSC